MPDQAHSRMIFTRSDRRNQRNLELFCCRFKQHVSENVRFQSESFFSLSFSGCDFQANQPLVFDGVWKKKHVSVSFCQFLALADDKLLKKTFLVFDMAGGFKDHRAFHTSGGTGTLGEAL